MPRQDDVRKIVLGGRARGLSDDQIRGLVQRYDARQTAAPVESSTPDTSHAGIGNQNVRGMMQRLDTRGDELRQEAVDHPIRTALTVAAPAALGKVPALLGKLRPTAAPLIKSAGEFLETPIIGGAIGAAQGYNTGGARGAVQGGLIGVAGGTALGKSLKSFGTWLTPRTANTGGRLVPRSTPSVTESISAALDDVRAPQPVQSVTLPSQPPGPSVTLSDKARKAASGRLQPIRGGKSGDLGSGSERMYQELASKPILTPEEQQTFSRLHAIMGARASQMGRSYAARGGR